MTLILKNQTGSNITYNSVGITVLANSSSTIVAADQFILVRDALLRADVRDRNVFVNDGFVDYTQDDALAYLDDLLSQTNNVGLDGYKSTYSAVALSLVAAATPTDIFTITGSASKTIRILEIFITGTQN